MKRYKIATLMTIILYLAIGWGALLNPADGWIWESTIYSLTAFIMTTATLLAFVRRGRERMAWTGFAVFGWAYLLLLGFERFQFGQKPKLLTTWILYEMLESGRDWFRYSVEMGSFSTVGHAYLALLFGLLGARLGRSLAAPDDSNRQNPCESPPSEPQSGT